MNLAAGVIGGVALAGVVGAQLASPAPSSAQAQGAQQVRIPSPVILNPCNGELIVTTGLQHFVVLSKGTHSLVHQNFQDVKGVGQSTQALYVISGSSELHISGTSFTDISVLHIISVSTGQNLISTIVVNKGGKKVHDNTRCSGSGAAQLAASEALTAGSPTAVAGTVNDTASIQASAGPTASHGTTLSTPGAIVSGTSASASLAPLTPSHRWASTRGIQHSTTAPGQQHSAASANTQSTASGTPTSPSAHSHRFLK